MKTQDNFQNCISRTTFRTISTTSLGIRTPSSSRQVVHNRRKIQGKRIKTNVAIAISHEPSGKNTKSRRIRQMLKKLCRHYLFLLLCKSGQEVFQFPSHTAQNQGLRFNAVFLGSDEFESGSSGRGGFRFPFHASTARKRSVPFRFRYCL